MLGVTPTSRGGGAAPTRIAPWSPSRRGGYYYTRQRGPGRATAVLGTRSAPPRRYCAGRTNHSALSSSSTKEMMSNQSTKQSIPKKGCRRSCFPKPCEAANHSNNEQRGTRNSSLRTSWLLARTRNEQATRIINQSEDKNQQYGTTISWSSSRERRMLGRSGGWVHSQAPYSESSTYQTIVRTEHGTVTVDLSYSNLGEEESAESS